MINCAPGGGLYDAFITITFALFLTVSAHGFQWVSAYESHATGHNINSAQKAAIQKGMAKSGNHVQMCKSHSGKLTSRAERVYCLLDSPAFPAECVYTIFLTCKSDLELVEVEDPQVAEGFYYGEDDSIFFELNKDLSFKTSLNASFRKGQSIALPSKVKVVGNNKYFMTGTIEADNRCKTTVSIEIEKLNDGMLVIKETGPHALNWNFGCHWSDVYPTFYNLKPLKIQN